MLRSNAGLNFEPSVACVLFAAWQDDPTEPLPDFDLSGLWVDAEGGQMEVTQSKHTVTAKPTQPQHWSSAHGRIKDHTIPRMPFNTIVLTGEISDDENTITWSNDVVWTRVEETTDEPESDSEPSAEDATSDEAAAVND
eukprot:COSAG02_NODE_22703_length_743_cov_0.684783_1_plen_138_part_10